MCQVTDCNKKIIARNLCQFHYDRQRRYGDLKTRPKTKNCETCNIVFDVRLTGNLPRFCDSCQVEHHRKRQRSDRRRKGLWEMYKLTLDEYQAMHDAQKGLCKICHQTTVGRGAKNNQLAVDHCHKTGRIRGLLCSKCNTGIGLLNDDVALLYKAIDYLLEN